MNNTFIYVYGVQNTTTKLKMVRKDQSNYSLHNSINNNCTITRLHVHLALFVAGHTRDT